MVKGVLEDERASMARRSYRRASGRAGGQRRPDTAAPTHETAARHPTYLDGGGTCAIPAPIVGGREAGETGKELSEGNGIRVPDVYSDRADQARRALERAL